MEQKLCAWIVAQRNNRVIVTKNMCLALARKWGSASDIEIMWAKSAPGVWGPANGDWQMFLPTEKCTTRVMS